METIASTIDLTEAAGADTNTTKTAANDIDSNRTEDTNENSHIIEYNTRRNTLVSNQEYQHLQRWKNFAETVKKCIKKKRARGLNKKINN